MTAADAERSAPPAPGRSRSTPARMPSGGGHGGGRLAALNPRPGSIPMIENVGNLVCPAMFDLGERMKVAVISTPEGADKPFKIPAHVPRRRGRSDQQDQSALHVDFDIDFCVAIFAR